MKLGTKKTSVSIAIEILEDQAWPVVGHRRLPSSRKHNTSSDLRPPSLRRNYACKAMFSKFATWYRQRFQHEIQPQQNSHGDNSVQTDNR